MRLSCLSLLFSLAWLLILAINGGISAGVLQAFARAGALAEERVEVLASVEALRRESELLVRLVRTYAVSGEARHLDYYHTLLAIRDGRQPALEPEGDPATYWDRVIAGETAFVSPPDGPRRPLQARFAALGLEAPEMALLARVLEAATALQALEERALAGPQALARLYGAAHERQHLRLSAALAALQQRLETRSAAALGAARADLQGWIAAALASMTGTALLALLAFRMIRRQVLLPLEQMGALTGKLASGQYGVRLGGLTGVAEVRTLRDTLNAMAAAIETDIREREGIEQALTEARARAEQATEAKSMFLANMSHEIRTPLNAVIGMAELILHSRLLPRQRDYAEKIRSAGRVLLGTLNDILDFSKIEAGRLELEKIPFRLEQVVAAAFLQVERTALEKGVELLFEPRPGSAAVLGEVLVGDPLRLGQVLANLLSNAVKFTPAGHVSLRIDTPRQADGTRRLGLTVEDTGIGMRAEQVDQLFEDFVQADGATTRQFGGSGLGLAIVRRLVTAMGGEIRVRSAPKRGSVFQVLLPLLPEAGAAAPLAAPRLALRVLVADDYPEARLALIDLLNFGGIDDVEAASCGEELLECLQEAAAAGRPYDLLLLDWSLPDRDGAAILARLREAPALAPRHLALLSVPRGIDDEAIDFPPERLHYCDKPLLPGTLRRLCDALLGVAPATPLESGSFEGMRVLLVEDNATSRDVAVALLGRWGVEVDSAVDGRDALAQLAAHPPAHYALVFMDLQMPGMDGYEAVRQLRTQPSFASLPVYALSAHSARSVRERCLALGMRGCLGKPYELSELHAVLALHYHGPGGAPALPPAGPPATAVQGLEDIPGLDPRCAINDTGVSPTLYPRLLAKFRQQFADGPGSVRQDVEARAWPRVTSFAHTLKGRAGLLGMAEISAIAGRLEAAGHAADLARAQAALQALDERLKPIVEGLGKLLPPEFEEAGEGSPENAGA